MAEDKGGAIDCGDGSPLVEECAFIECSGGIGGAVCAQGPAVIRNCVFIKNTVDHTEYGGYGGGIAVYGTSPAMITNCVIYGCASKNKGGGVYVEEDCSANFINCTLSGNQAVDGAGFHLEDAGPLSLSNCIVAFSVTGAAFSGSGAVDIIHSDVFGNAGGDWAGPIAGKLGQNNNISIDPFFVDAGIGDLHLRFTSPCRNAGDNSIATELLDFEGDPRIAFSRVDIGADEFYSHLYYTGTVSPGWDSTIKCVGIPGTSPVRLFISTGILNPSMPSMWGKWHLMLPVVGPIDLGKIPSPDGILKYMNRIPHTALSGSTFYLQALIGTELTNLSELKIK